MHGKLHSKNICTVPVLTRVSSPQHESRTSSFLSTEKVSASEAHSVCWKGRIYKRWDIQLPQHIRTLPLQSAVSKFSTSFGERVVRYWINKGWFTSYVKFPFRHRSIFVPSDWSVFTLSVVFCYLPAEHVIEGPRLSPWNMQPHSFSKRQLAAIALMLDEKNVLLWVTKRSVHKCFRSRKSEGEYWTLYKELADDEMKVYQYFRMSKHQVNYLLQNTEKDLKKKNTTFREAISPVEKLATYLR